MAVFADIDGADPIKISDEAYDSTTWNDSLDGATKNALRDKFEVVDALITSTADAKISDTAYAASWDGVATVAPSKNAVYDKVELMLTDIASNTSNISELPSTENNILANQVFN